MKTSLKLLTCITVAFLSLVPCRLDGYEERNLITAAIDELSQGSLAPESTGWLPYPGYEDRPAWQKMFGDYSQTIIAEGAKYLDYRWQPVLASAYLEYERSGDRQVMERPYEANRKALNILALAELAEGKGRFMDAIADGLWFSCQMFSWAYSAHLPRQSSSRSLPDCNEQIIDLGSAGYAASISLICTLLADRLDAIDPSIRAAARQAVKEKILNPYMDKSLYEAHWWLAEDWRPGQIINNWNPWCNSNVLLCFLLIENDRNIVDKAIRFSAASTDRFLNYVKGDGACEEGPSYWGHAAGKLYDYLKILECATGGEFNLFGNSLVRSMGEYISRSSIGDGWVVNFADATAKMTPDIPLVYRYGKDCGSSEMEDFALSLLYDGKRFRRPRIPLGNDIWRSLESIRYSSMMIHELDSLNVLCASAENASGDLYGTPEIMRSLRSEVPACTWYPETEFAYMRNSDGWFLAAKGGYNNESHNHNDVGTFILFIDGSPVFIDAGVGTYTKKTFSHERYTIWSMQSSWHNLPEVNGTSQIFGDEFRARGTDCNIKKRTFSTDIAGAYSSAAGCSSWTRSYTLKDEALEITDRFSLSERIAADTVNFLVRGSASISSDMSAVTIETDGVRITLDYPEGMAISVAQMILDDPRLSNVWGSSIKRISFVSPPDSGLKGKYVFRVERVE